MQRCSTVEQAAYRLLSFFQAEDGIRGGHVTGVQTCALPISAAHELESATDQRLIESENHFEGDRMGHGQARFTDRSEERRVGEEWRWRWTRAGGEEEAGEEGGGGTTGTDGNPSRCSASNWEQ